MKILKFLLVIIFSFLFKTQILLADEAKMIKGLEIFNETAGCAACHVLKAAASEGNIGPNLDAYQLNNPGFIVPAVVDPNLGIHEEYAGFNVVTKDNQRLTGFIAQNAPRFIVLRDLAQNNITLARDEIKELNFTH